MSIAKAIIGRKPEAPAATTQESVERPMTPEELIDAVAESEFPLGEAEVTRDTTGVGSPADGGAAPSAMKTGKSSKGDMTKGKKTKGQVAPTPSGSDPVKYGAKK